MLALLYFAFPAFAQVAADDGVWGLATPIFILVILAIVICVIWIIRALR